MLCVSFQVSSSSLGGLLTKGLGRFGLNFGGGQQRSASLADCTTLLVFVVGGLSAGEAAEVKRGGARV